MKLTTIAGLVGLGTVVFVVLASQSSRHDHRDLVLNIAVASPTPTPTMVPHPTPAPPPAPMDETTGVLEHAALWGWLAALAILPLFALVGIALHARHRARLLDPNMPPLRDREAVARVYDVRSLEARRGWLPESFTFAPRYTNREVEVEEEAPTPAPPSLGSVDDLLNHGRGLAFGWRIDNGELLVDRQVRSLLVGGVQGSGKTSFVALLVAQLVRQEARVMLADPDALNEQGLARRLAGLGIRPEATAHEPAAVLRLVLNAQHELLTRKGQGPHADRRPYIVAIDELPECLRTLNAHDSGLLRDALELVGGFSGRKHSMAVIMLGQSWSKSVVGSTAIRNLITSSAVFRMRSDEAFYMTNLKAQYWRAAGPDPLDLEPGHCYIVGVDSGAVRVRVPALPPTRARVELPPASTHFPATSHVLPHPLPNRISEAPGKRAGSGAEVLSEAAVLRLFRAGHSVSAIVRELTGERGGRAFQRAHEEVSEVIRRGLR